MIAIDTNILVRYITQDDPDQSQRAARFMESLTSEKPGFIGLVSIAELGWVLNRTYRLSRAEFIRAMQILVSSEDLLIESESLVKEALVLFAASNADFGDCLISRSALSYGCLHVATFDRKAARTLGMRLLT